ncbi:MarR family winged helix-turn-helix transcriptional regulator [Parapedobacter koreensis]|uniref:DNA-binding transcriptional regulator, MarR family n=1 Tax=Parapedobacter koreensis TaxID=332977 RepID=A0A1H7M4L5_9SPHI|nr:MarR family transcriptional regulator [Parapedobacter koreensis]SEL05527.1 DNA-binding transcriptional regulator, MarR family [Parapedobacter koreensis]
MKIEDEIQTRKFRNERQKATINIVFTSNWITSILEKRANAQQITLQQFNVLRILRGQHPSPVTNSLLKERMLDKMPDVSRIIDRLVSKGMVTRGVCDRDRRAVDVMITQKGLDTLAELEDNMLMMDILQENISEDECRILNELLDRLRGYRPPAAG